MAARFILIISVLASLKGLSQQQFLSAGMISRLDSISMSAGDESYFAELYLRTAISADSYIETLPLHGKILMRRLEQNFAQYFFRAIDSNYHGRAVPEEWKNYFNGRGLSELQLKLMGANAHINGDIWQAMTSTFSSEEIRELRPYYKNYNRSISKVFDDLYESAIKSDKRVRNLHALTLGLDKVYGRMMLRKWRNRQLRLAVLRDRHPKNFNRMKKRTETRMKNIDEMIIRRL